MSENPNHHANTGQTPTGHIFNACATYPREIETKDLVKDNNPETFQKVVDHFTSEGWVRSVQMGKHLMTLQLDTPDLILLNNDGTLRQRNECLDNNLNKQTASDICYKGRKNEEESGALGRNEYEASHPLTSSNVTLDPLLQKYNRQDHPDLFAAMDLIKGKDLMVHFRIDCVRNRYVIEIPESETGIKGKKVFGEMLLDSVAFVLDLPRLPSPIIFHYDMEIEKELLFKQCLYDPNPDAKNFITSPLTKEENMIVEAAYRKHLNAAAPGELTPNFDSKAERGYKALDALLEVLGDYIEKRTKPDSGQHHNRLRSAFRLQGGGPERIMPVLLQHDSWPVMKYHQIATRSPGQRASTPAPLLYAA